MNYNKYLKFAFAGVVGVALMQFCVKSDDFSIPDIVCQDQFPAANHQLSDLQSLALVKPTEADIIQEDFIVEGFVSSSDQSGNIFKAVYVQDKPENPTFAIEIDIDAANQYVNYPLGAKIKLNVKGLIVQATSNNVKVGSFDPGFDVGRINPNRLQNYLARACGPDGLPVIAQMVPQVFDNISDAMQPEHINKLITLKNVQFKDAELGKNFSNDGATGDRYIMDENRTELDLRFSNFADFSNEKIEAPYDGSGDITLILSRFRDTYQAYLRDLSDINFTNPRLKLPLVVDFENFANNATNLSPNFNLSVVGTRLWQVRNFSNNNYIQLSAFGSGDVVTHLAIPVSFTGDNELSFLSNSNFYTGDVLHVYWSLDYDPANPAAATLHELTDQFDISKRLEAEGYEATYRPSGKVQLPAAANGEGFVIFEYKGSSNGGATTTMQLDNISFK